MAKASKAPETAAGDSTSDGTSEELADIAGLSYEQARDELVAIVAQLEGGQVGLEDSMRLWRRGEALAAHCSGWLDGAEAALTRDDAGDEQ